MACACVAETDRGPGGGLSEPWQHAAVFIEFKVVCVERDAERRSADQASPTNVLLDVGLRSSAPFAGSSPELAHASA